MKILIVGAGISGTVAAALLSRQGHDLTLIDKHAGDGGSGYVLGLWPLGNRILHGLNLYSAFEERSIPLKAFATAAPNGAILNSFEPRKIVSNLGEIRMVKRSELLEVLRLGTSDIERKTPLTIASLTQHEQGVDIVFDNGDSDSFDLVIGCDGIHSKVRELAFDAAEHTDTGWYGWGWWLDPKLCQPDTMTEYWHPGHRFIATYPAKNLACAFAGLPASTFEDPEDFNDLDKVKACFADMQGNVPTAIESLTSDNKVHYDKFRTLVTENWVSNRVALVGDAASAYFPYGGLGLGASMAMESAAVLADELSRANPTTLNTSLHFYQLRRLNRVRQFEQTAGKIVEMMLHAKAPPAPEVMLGIQKEHFLTLRTLIESPI